MVPIYGMASLVSLSISLFLVNPFTKPWSVRELLLLLGPGLLSTVFGHSILNRAMTHLRGQLAGIVNMGQFVFAGIMAYVAFTEVPSLHFLSACTLVVGGALLAMWNKPSKVKDLESKGRKL